MPRDEYPRDYSAPMHRAEPDIARGTRHGTEKLYLISYNDGRKITVYAHSEDEAREIATIRRSQRPRYVSRRALRHGPAAEARMGEAQDKKYG